MDIFFNIFDGFKGNIVLWYIVCFYSCFIYSLSDILFFKTTFNLTIKKNRFIIALIVDTITKVLFMSFINLPYYRALFIISTILLFRFILKEKIEKSVLGEVINTISIISFEVIFAKIYCIIFNCSYVDGMFNYKFFALLSTSVLFFRFIFLIILKVKKVHIIINDYITKEDRRRIILIAIMGCTIIFLNAAEVFMFINDLPYVLFIIDILSLLLYFLLSVSNVMKTARLENLDVKVDNLEAYNKTITIMYDKIRGFKHDYFNMIQALDGLAKAGDIDGINQMCKTLKKECREINNMSILDPNIINDPAVFSIMINKYNLACLNKIRMNIEVLIDIKALDISSYELSRILGILLDNAIEASMECKKKVINVRFIKDLNRKRNLIIIENTYNNENIDLDKIFDKGYSSKTEEIGNHGLGLWNVRNILKEHDNLNLYTYASTMFVQQLEIYEKMEK